MFICQGHARDGQLVYLGVLPILCANCHFVYVQIWRIGEDPLGHPSVRAWLLVRGGIGSGAVIVSIKGHFFVCARVHLG